MLFIIDSSLDEIAENPGHPLYSNFIDEITALSRARNAGRAIVFLESVKLYSLVTKASEFSNHVKSICSFLNRQRSFKLEILKNVNVAVRITASAQQISTIKKGNRCELIIPLDKVPFELFNSPVLLAENLSDAKAYIIFTRMALEAGVSGLPPAGLNAELRGGGGSTIATEYIAAKNKGDRLVLCVLDSDVRYPGCQSNAWSQAIKSHDANQPNALTASEIIDVYSIENLFPISCLTDLKPYKTDKNAAFALEKELPLLQEHAKEPYWRYIRLKNGVSCKDLRDTGELGKFWSIYKGAFENFSSKKCEHPPYACKHDCARNPRFRDDTLQSFVERYEAAPAAELKNLHNSIPAHVAGHFDNLARVIASWMCFGKPILGVSAA